MSAQIAWTAAFVIVTFGAYALIAIISRAGSTADFYVAGHHVPPFVNGMATAADWMSAASFISMAGIIAFSGYWASAYLMGWTGGFVLLALLIAPYLRKFDKFTVPDFVGDRYGSDLARFVAVICAIFVSFTYIAGQMRGVGIAFSRFLELPVELGVIIGALIVMTYAAIGGMKGITYTQVAQYCVLIFAYLVPAIFISLVITGQAIPQLGFIGDIRGEEGVSLIQRLDQVTRDLGFAAYTENTRTQWDVFAITLSLMVGTAGLPHVIIRFFTVPKASDARVSAGWALIFIALLYTTAPAVAAFARLNFVESVNGSVYDSADSSVEDAITPSWFSNWQETGLIGWVDRNNDGRVQYSAGAAFDGAPRLLRDEDGDIIRGARGEPLYQNPLPEGENEVYVDRDIMVLANPEIANLPPWVVGLVVAGGLAAALSTAAGLLLVISASVSHDLCRKIIFKGMSDRQEMLVARLSAVGAVMVAIYAGINPPGFVAAVVAFAFGLAAASFFPVILLGIFWKRMNKWGAVLGMGSGLILTGGYIVYFKILNPGLDNAEHWLFGVSPEGFGAIGMMVNFAVSIGVSLITPAPPPHLAKIVDDIRMPTMRRAAPPAE